MNAVAPDRRSGAWAVSTAIIASLSYLLARFVGLGPHPGPWAYWPVLGALLGIFYRRPKREWPLLAVSAVAAQVVTVWVTRGDLAHGATIEGAIAGVAQAMLGAWLLRGIEGGDVRPGRMRDLGAFVAIACVIPLVVSPLTAIFFSNGLGLPYETTWRPLFVGNSLSILLFAPFFMRPWKPLAEMNRRLLAEGISCQALIVLLSWLTFSGLVGWERYVALPFALFPLLAWSAVRCGERWTAFALIVIGTISAWCTARGNGPFANLELPLDERVLQLQTYLAFAAFTTLLLSALMAQRRHAFRELALQHAVQRGFFESSSAMIVLKDLAGRYLLVNRSTEHTQGLTRTEMLGRTDRENLPADVADMVEAHDRRTLDRGEPMTFEEAVVLGGTARQYTTTRFPVRDDDGVVRYVGVIAHDVTVERELTGRLERAQRVELMGQLAAGLAHDLNNLLSVVVANSDLLRLGGTINDADAELVQDMHEAGSRATKLTKRLLSFGRTGPSRRVPLDVEQSIEELAPMLRVLARGSVDVVLALRAPGVQVIADPVEVEQIILNLVSNARDSIVGDGTITISTELADASASNGDRRLVVRVTDEGAGMDAETLAQIFQPFFSTKSDKGTGLGLYTTALLVREMGGTIEATSRVGEGSSFVLTLPVVQASAH